MKKLITILSILLLSVGAMAQQSITINIPDYEIEGSKFKRKATAERLLYSLQGKSVSVLWRVNYYADSAGTYGQEINRPGIGPYIRETIANNTVMVNPSTGAFVYKDGEGNYPVGSIGQYDFFFNIAENADVNVNDLIRAYGIAVENW